MKIERLIIGGVALLVGLLLGWMVRGVATYNVHAASIASYDDWRVACPAAQPGPNDPQDLNCELSSDVVAKAQGNSNVLARVSITTEKDGKKTIGFIVPFGVALEAKMGLRIGKDPKDPVKVYPYRTCNTAGCIVTTPFDDAMATALNNASDAAVMVAGLDGKVVSAPMSFKGYKKSLTAWQAGDLRRKSWLWRLWS
jgi:invasion protein IalB